MWFLHSSRPNRSSNEPMDVQSASSVRAWVLRNKVLSLEKTCSIRLKSGLYGGDLVRAQVIHHHDVANHQLRHQALLNPRYKCRTIDRSVQHQRRQQTLIAQRTNKRGGEPVAKRRMPQAALASGRAAPGERHVSGGPGVNQDKSVGLARSLAGAARRASWRAWATSLRACSLAKRVFFFVSNRADSTFCPWSWVRPTGRALS